MPPSCGSCARKVRGQTPRFFEGPCSVPTRPANQAGPGPIQRAVTRALASLHPLVTAPTTRAFCRRSTGDAGRAIGPPGPERALSVRAVLSPRGEPRFVALPGRSRETRRDICHAIASCACGGCVGAVHFLHGRARRCAHGGGRSSADRTPLGSELFARMRGFVWLWMCAKRSQYVCVQNEGGVDLGVKVGVVVFGPQRLKKP